MHVMFFALVTDIDFDEFRSSIATAVIPSEVVSIVQLYVLEDRMDIENKWVEYVAILCGGFLGLWAGNHFAKYYLSQTGFMTFMLYLMSAGGVVLALKGVWTPLFDVILTATLLALPVLCLAVYFVRRLSC